MPNTTRCKYIAIGANVVVILLSLSILASLYLFSVSNGGNPQSSESNSSRLLRQQGEADGQTERQVSQSYLPASVQHFINWLGQSVSSSASSGGEEPSTSLFTAGRPLIVAAFLSYVLAIVGSIAIGLEHVTLLIILVVIFAFIFASSLCALVFSFFGTALQNGTLLLDFWSCLLIAIICITAVQVCLHPSASFL